jgi:tRNA modification GTPase
VQGIFVINKIDLDAGDHGAAAPAEMVTTRIAAKTGAGLEALGSQILRAAGWADGEGVFLARTRHLEALRLCAEHLDLAVAQMVRLELCAEELRLAQLALASITGAVSADDLLGKIFSQFCNGK